MEINLVPLYFKKIMRAIKIVTIIVELIFILVLCVMGLIGMFSDITTAILFCSLFLMFPSLMLIPGFLYEKVSQSTVDFSYDRIRVFDKHGHCWREIVYDLITDVKVEEIYGFFYGKNKENISNAYTCFFLNGETKIPEVSYAKLFTQKKFFMISYSKESFEVFNSFYSSYKPQSQVQNNKIEKRCFQ